MKVKTSLKPFVLAAFLLIGCGLRPLSAQILLNFSSDQYSPNFQETLNGSQVSYNSTNQNVAAVINPQNTSSIFVYDTAPGTSGYDNSSFLAETISYDAVFTSGVSNFAGAPSTGIYTRIQSNSLGVLALVNILGGNDSTSIQLRLFYGASVTSTNVGTAFYNATFSSSTGLITSQPTGSGGTGSTNVVSLGSPVTLTLTQTSAADPVFNFTISDGQGFVASTGDQTLTSAMSNAYDGAGAVGVRTNFSASTGTITVDNFSVVPEPSTYALLGVGLLTLVLLRRKAKAVRQA